MRLAALLAFLLMLGLPSFTDAKQRVDKAADLPRFSYKFDGKLEDVVRDDALFKRFSAMLRRDLESVLAGYEIPDKAVERGYLVTLAQLDYLEGRYDAALARLDAIRALEEKPADKLVSGLTMRSMIAAERAGHARGSEAFRRDVQKRVREALDAMPYAVVQNEVREIKASAEIVGEPLIVGSLRERLQPIVDKAGSLSSDFAPALVNARYRMQYVVPLKAEFVAAYGGYLAANKVDKPEIWSKRDVALKPGAGHAPVNVAIWDSGVDTTLFADRLVKANGRTAVIGFDRYEKPANTELIPIAPELRQRLPRMTAMLKGFSDLQSNIDSKEAADLKQHLSTLKPEAYKSTIEEINLAGNYIHGTHVAGIAMAGNPYARLAVARIEFDWHLTPDPCPTPELVAQGAKNAAAYVDFFKRHDVRVVNMSWGGSVNDYENALEQCGIGKDPEDRKKIARKYFDTGRDALTKAIRGAPGILFVAAAGNENADADFAESIPAAIDAPNLLTVGAVDRAGDEASFTSYGKTVAAHANGYQVESVIPGGEKIAESGTSMAAPQATNLAAKMLAVNPKLTPVQVIRLIRDTTEKTPDGRRMLLDPAKAVAAARQEKG
ncbi:MAG TPA: S8 family serine peptidase [Casimicrobiaceae bacterium]|nr:S8 family serine peptidase [Casimicrobiaceae bacterium]